MSFARSVARRNLKGRPVRTAGLILLAAFLSLSVLAGSVIVMSLQNGLKSYQARLGADIVAVPNEARTKGQLEGILLQGIPGYFYMDDAVVDKIRATEGVAAATPQFYLASASAGCCSTAVQIIGFEPETDFIIQPWIRESYAGEIGFGDILVGYNIGIPMDGKLKFYNMDCRVVAQLDRTGTGLDNAVYANMDTIREMMKYSRAAGFHLSDGLNIDRVVSSVMIQVADGYDIDQVAGELNIHLRRVEAIQTQSMISGIAGGLEGVSHIIGVLVVLIWVLAIVILIIAFLMISNERKREFAVLRVAGASQKMLSRLLLTEAAITSSVGAVIGVAVGLLILLPFNSLIHSRLELPYLLPGAAALIALAVGAVVISVVAGSLTAAVSARRISRHETGLILREGA